MQAFKCDRCGEYYDENLINDFNYNVVNKLGTPIDLCTSCRYDLEKFIDDGKKVGDKNGTKKD